jgi:hypothetical protein
MSIFDSATSLQDQVLATVKTAEDAVVSATKSIVEPLATRLPSTPLAANLPRASDLVNNSFSFAEKVLANQKEFYNELAQVFSSRSIKPKA